MSAGHNAGPWACVGKDGRCLDYNDWNARSEHNGTSESMPIHDANGTVVALVVSRSPDAWGRAPDMSENARLIAAAPELLDALDAIIKRAENPALSDDTDALLRAARAAIAKATKGTP
jgi:phage gp29-like protein